MLRIDELKLPLDYDEKTLKTAICGFLKTSEKDIASYKLVRRSVDARKKDDVHYTLAVDVELFSKEAAVLKKNRRVAPAPKNDYVPPQNTGYKGQTVVVGSGPAGLFCTYFLAKAGQKPILIERGDDIELRSKKVEEFWNTGILDTESNVQFGAGGAGTFSDGKLNTAIKDKSGRIRTVLEIFVENGAPEDILYDAKPHIGTDVLKTVVSNMIASIRELGGTVRFGAKLTDIRFKAGCVSAAVLENNEDIPCEQLVLAIGHSARDTFAMLKNKGIIMEQKPFAVGLRVEHPQAMINASQYGDFADKLPPAPYKLTYTGNGGRGVYSFCMCPGGFVVNASSEQGRLAVNGMSYRARASKNANSAIIVTVDRKDFENDDALAGLAFQEKLEKAASDAALGKIPQQLFEDFKNRRTSSSYGEFASEVKGAAAFADLREVLPEGISLSFIDGMEAFDRRINGFARPDAILSGVESRTSSPVRIVRNEALQSSIKGLYPCGEGAGYAGGIVSAAVDGIKVFEAIVKE